MASQRKIATATAAAGGLLAVGGATYAFADNQTPAPTPSASSSTSTDQAPAQNQQQSQDKTVTGTVADQVKAAVKAKDSSVTISEVRQDPDGSYDALGAKTDGTKVFYDVSKDLKTITLNAGGQGRGGHGASQDKAVTGTVAEQVKAAVKAKDSSVTISEVRQDADGSYDALGTKSDGTKVFYDVSKDLKTVTANTAPQGKNAPSGTSTGN